MDSSMAISVISGGPESCPCSNLHTAGKDWRFSRPGHTVTVMVTILCALVSIFEFRVRSRANLELELIALRHTKVMPDAPFLEVLFGS
jgi:hypothetical protein